MLKKRSALRLIPRRELLNFTASPVTGHAGRATDLVHMISSRSPPAHDNVSCNACLAADPRLESTTRRTRLLIQRLDEK